MLLKRIVLQTLVSKQVNELWMKTSGAFFNQYNFKTVIFSERPVCVDIITRPAQSLPGHITH